MSQSAEECFPKVWVAPGVIHDDGTHYLLRHPSDQQTTRPTVILVHGIGSFFASFSHVADILLKEGYSTLQYDFYGRGFSGPSPSGKYDEHIHIEQLEKLLAFLRGRGEVTEKVHLVGHSMGGSFVALFTAKHAQTIKSVTFCTPAGLMNSWALGTLSWCGLIEPLLKPIIIGKSQMIRATHRDFHLSDGIYGQRKEEYLHQMMLQAEHHPQFFDVMWKCLWEFPLNDITDRVTALSQHAHLRVLVLWAQYDQMIPMGYNLGRWESILEKGHSQWRSHVVEDAGHMFIVEHFEQVAAEILATIRQTDDESILNPAEPFSVRPVEAVDSSSTS